MTNFLEPIEEKPYRPSGLNTIAKEQDLRNYNLTYTEKLPPKRMSQAEWKKAPNFCYKCDLCAKIERRCKAPLKVYEGGLVRTQKTLSLCVRCSNKHKAARKFFKKTKYEQNNRSRIRKHNN